MWSGGTSYNMRASFIFPLLIFKNHFLKKQNKTKTATRRDFQLKSPNRFMIQFMANNFLLESHLDIFLLGLLFGIIFRKKYITLIRGPRTLALLK